MFSQSKKGASPDILVKTVEAHVHILITVLIFKVNGIVTNKVVTFLPDHGGCTNITKGIASAFTLVKFMIANSY